LPCVEKLPYLVQQPIKLDGLNVKFVAPGGNRLLALASQRMRRKRDDQEASGLLLLKSTNEMLLGRISARVTTDMSIGSESRMFCRARQGIPYDDASRVHHASRRSRGHARLVAPARIRRRLKCPPQGSTKTP